MMISITISVALLSVIIIAAMIGTIVPIFLNKNKIDPAIATGPFITTSNDILGVMVYFTIAKLILGL
jgi:mgtE family divalent cation transporter